MSEQTSRLRWGVEQRLEFIEFRLFWEGGVNRSDLTSYFGVSVPQASADLSKYQSLAPDNIAYDKSQKRYVATEGFQPRFMRPDADRYLAQLRSIGDGVLTTQDTWLMQQPEFETVPLPHRNVDADVLRAIVAAIRTRSALEIRYQSLSATRPHPTWRWITPHALAFDGQRWHARAFCHIERNFADFLLPRVLGSRGIAEGEATQKADTAWNTAVAVVLKPHPRLNEDQRRIVAKDFGMKSERLNVPVRAALLYYFLKRLNLDFEEEKRPPQEQHVVLANPDAVTKALGLARIG